MDTTTRGGWGRCRPSIHLRRKKTSSLRIAKNITDGGKGEKGKEEKRKGPKRVRGEGLSDSGERDLRQKKENDERKDC